MLMKIVNEKKTSSPRKKSAGAMNLVFRRTGTRRYVVEARREKFPDLEMDPAPGFDSLMPHDMMHLVVEAELGLTNGIFGQLAIGGDGGTFRPIVDEHKSARTTARLRRHQRARGKPLLRDGKADCGLSERATYVCWHEWLRRTGKLNPADRRVVAMQSLVPGIKSLDEQRFQSICKHLDELSSVWADLGVGESMSVSWPDLKVSKPSSAN